MQVKNIIKDYIKTIPTDEFGLFLSGGMDSLLILVSLIELNKKTKIYSFTRTDRESYDYTRAKAVASYFNLEFQKIELKMDDKGYLFDSLKILKYIYKAKKKTEFECVFPFFESLPLVTNKHILVGHAADGHFCISKKGMLHWRDNIDQFRRDYFSNPKCCQNHILRPLFKSVGADIYFPYMQPELVNFFLGKSWDECNRPKQKQLIRDSFSGLSLPVSLDNHTNLQLGDSGIADGFNILLEGTNFKNTVAIYNRI